MERVERGCLSISAYNLAGLSATSGVFSATAGWALRELCRPLIEPAATIRWLVHDADDESGQDLYDGVIDVASRPVMPLAQPGDVVRIPYNILTNACRIAGLPGIDGAVVCDVGV